MGLARVFTQWKREVDELMHVDYAITIVDSGIDDDELYKYWKSQLSANEFVEWVATKYNLTSVAEWKRRLTRRLRH